MTEPKPLAELVEDLTFLADTHVGITAAARRTGFSTPAALDKWLRRHHQVPLLNRLCRYDPVPLGTSRKAS